ncbi:hypothetical protein LINPERHAP2_LOCUS19583 [Linum perenne]
MEQKKKKWREEEEKGAELMEPGVPLSTSKLLIYFSFFRTLPIMNLGFLISLLGTNTTSTPSSTEALTSLVLIMAFSGSRNLRRNFPLQRSTLCHLLLSLSSSEAG